MLFNSLEYLIFLPLVVLGFFILPHKRRWFLLLVASYYFYMSWILAYILLILASTVVDYFVSLKMSRTTVKSKRRKFLYLSLLANLGLLFTFKYLGFFTESLNQLSSVIGWNYSIETLNLLLPVGISFYTFQTLSYTIDVYNGKVKPEKHFGIFALYVSFFPQLVAGPIERPDHLLPQLRKRMTFNHENLRDGLTMIGWGLFKKVVIADRIAVGVNAVYNDASSHDGLSLMMATVLFAFQIYADFSGYSDIAIGSARIMGFDLMRNFDRPYFSKSVSEFWRRWHISLSTWFRDYVYIPLGGNRVVKWRWYYNLFITFAVSGLWHGAAWTFVIWGALHGTFLIFATIKEKPRDRLLMSISLSKSSFLYRVFATSVTFILVNFAWIFFRANSWEDARYIIANLFTNVGSDLADLSSFKDIADLVSMSVHDFYIALAAIALMTLSHYLSRGQRQPILRLADLPIYIRWPLYYALALVIILFGVFDSSEFIYFQF